MDVRFSTTPSFDPSSPSPSLHIHHNIQETMAQAVRGQDDAEFGQAQLIREATTQNVNPQQVLGHATTHDQLCDAMHENLLNTETESKTGRTISDLSLQARGRSLSTPSSAKF
nr:PREDICTED: uncharacterized protein LOC108953379 [Musa acuminata subsp. malaccensis]